MQAEGPSAMLGLKWMFGDSGPTGTPAKLLGDRTLTGVILDSLEKLHVPQICPESAKRCHSSWGFPNIKEVIQITIWLIKTAPRLHTLSPALWHLTLPYQPLLHRHTLAKRAGICTTCQTGSLTRARKASNVSSPWACSETATVLIVGGSGRIWKHACAGHRESHVCAAFLLYIPCRVGD